jgi:hypothetical protein
LLSGNLRFPHLPSLNRARTLKKRQIKNRTKKENKKRTNMNMKTKTTGNMKKDHELNIKDVKREPKLMEKEKDNKKTYSCFLS